MDTRTGSPVRPGGVPAGYTLRSELPAGRLGDAFLCRDDGSGREVVVRVLGARPRDERARAVLETELAAAAVASRHPCAVPIEAAFNDERLGACVRQRHFPGGSAQARLDAGASWQSEDVALLGLRAAAALAHSHLLGVLHLDVRPANLLADAAGEWCLADGGLTRAVFGAPVALDARYAPRELLGWEEPGPACDVYGLGATLHVLLGGGPAGPGGELGPPRPGLQPALAGLVARMTSPDPSARPALTEVDRVLRTQLGQDAAGRVPDPPALARPTALPVPVRRFVTIVPEEVRTDVADRRRRAVVIAAGIAVLFVASAAATVASLDDAEEPAPVAVSALGPARMEQAKANPYLPTGLEFDKQGAQFVFSWGPPSQVEDIAGYVVLLTQPGTDNVIARQYSPPAQRISVFSNPPLTPDVCYTVGTLVDVGTTVELAVPPAPACDIADRLAMIAQDAAARRGQVASNLDAAVGAAGTAAVTAPGRTPQQVAGDAAGPEADRKAAQTPARRRSPDPAAPPVR